jgi:hypothetical protein
MLGLRELVLAEIGAIWRISVDSIRLARCDVGFRGSADSKRFTVEAEFLGDDKVDTPTRGLPWIVFILNELGVIFADRFDLIGVSGWIRLGIWTNAWEGREGTSGGTGWRVAGEAGVEVGVAANMGEGNRLGTCRQ